MLTRMNKYVLISCLAALFAAVVILQVLLPQSREKGPAESAGEKRTVVLYSSMQENQLEGICAEFESAYPGIKLVYFTAGTGKVLTKIAAELQSGTLGADLLWVADPFSADQLVADGLFEPYRSAYADDIPAEYRRSDGLMTPARLLIMGIAYNTRLVDRSSLPKNWHDLPSYGKMEISDPATSGSSLATLRMFVSSRQYGWPYIQALKNGGARLCSGSGATAYQVGSGACSLAVTPDNVVFMARSLGLPVAFYAPEDDIIAFTSPIALFRQSRHQEDAKAFIDFMLSDRGQQVLYSVGVTPIRGPLAPRLGPRMQESSAESCSNAELISRFDRIFLTE